MKLTRWNTVDRSAIKYPPVRNVNCLSTVNLSFEHFAIPNFKKPRPNHAHSLSRKKGMHYKSALNIIKQHRAKQTTITSRNPFTITELMSINNTTMNKPNIKLSKATLNKLRLLLIKAELPKSDNKVDIIRIDKRVKGNVRKRLLQHGRTISGFAEGSLAITQINLKGIKEGIVKEDYSTLPPIIDKFQPITEGSIIIRTKKKKNTN